MWLPECSGRRESFEDLSFLEGAEESTVLHFFFLGRSHGGTSQEKERKQCAT